MLYGPPAVVAIFCIFILSLLLTICLVICYNPKKTYLVFWTVEETWYWGSDMVKARSKYKAWRKVEKKHYLPIQLVQIKEIRE